MSKVLPLDKNKRIILYCTHLFVPLHAFFNRTNYNLKLKKYNSMNHYLNFGANWLQCVGTFCVKSSRDVTMCLTISQKGGLLQ